MALKKIESYFLVFLFVVAGVFFYMSAITRTTYPEPLTARVYGMIISGLFLLAVATRFIKIQSKSSKDAKSEEKFTIGHPMIILISTIAMIVYTVGIIYIGYYTMTFLYTFGMIMMLREDRPVKAWIVSALGCLVFTLILYWIFNMFNVYLPNAWLI